MYSIDKILSIELNKTKTKLKSKSYRQRLSLEERTKEAKDCRLRYYFLIIISYILIHLVTFRYPTKVPVVVERSKGEKVLGSLDKSKWIVPHEMTILQLSTVIRQRLSNSSKEQLFLLVNGRFERFIFYQIIIHLFFLQGVPVSHSTVGDSS